MMIVEFDGGMRFVARHAGHEVASDQTRKGGGEDTAMTPTALMIASLAMCVGVFVAYFAKRHDIALEGMQIEADYEMVENPRRVGEISVKVIMPEPVAPRYRVALQRAAENCVVHNTLHHPPEVTIALE